MLLTQPRKYQSKDAEFLAAQYKSRSDFNMGYLLASEQGCGKTLTILRALEMIREPLKVLICCPAGARNEWRRQIALHYSPKSFDVFLAKSSKDIAAYNIGELKAAGIEIKGIVPAKVLNSPRSGAPIEVLITGYHVTLLTGLSKDVKFDIVILDECQEISNPESGTSKAIQSIVEHSDAYLFPLSGTPAEDRPEQIWNAVRLCQPQEWGSDINSFRYRYLQKVPNEWAPNGYYLKGLKPERAKELSGRLAKVMIRHTKKEVAADLPPMILMLRHVPVKQIQFDWDNPESFENFNEQNIDVKTEETVKILSQARENSENRFVVFTHLHRTAENIGQELRKHNFDVVSLIGITPDARHKKVEGVAKAEKPTVLIASIEASGTAVDFTFATTAVFAEQHYVPGKTSQAAQRFHRLSSIHSTNVWFVVGEGTKEEIKAEIYCRKQKDLEHAYRGGEFEEKAVETLTIKDTEGLGDFL